LFTAIIMVMLPFVSVTVSKYVGRGNLGMSQKISPAQLYFEPVSVTVISALIRSLKRSMEISVIVNNKIGEAPSWIVLLNTCMTVDGGCSMHVTACAPWQDAKRVSELELR
jgi:hypothetical protein